jgi:NADPH:quinone reductase-like Zn-dependent oxidoreductase
VVPLSDGVGDVVAVGPGVTRAAVGDRVTGTYFRRWTAGPQRLAVVREQYGANHDGWLARYVLLAEESVVQVPDHLTTVVDPGMSVLGYGELIFESLHRGARPWRAN